VQLLRGCWKQQRPHDDDAQLLVVEVKKKKLCHR
jgi:hypothetical protein